MKNTILFSLLLLMAFCCESAFARSDEKVIIKTERVGNDTAEWSYTSYTGKKDVVFVSFKKDDLKLTKLGRKRLKGHCDWDAMEAVFHSKEGQLSQDSMKTLFLMSLTQEQITGLLNASRTVVLFSAFNGKGQVIMISYMLPAEAETLFSSADLYEIAKKIKKKVRFEKSPRNKTHCFQHCTLGRIRKDEFERYLKKE